MSDGHKPHSRVRVQSLAGEVLELELQANSKVADLKCAIAQSPWSVPAAVQRLLLVRSAEADTGTHPTPGVLPAEAEDGEELDLAVSYQLVISLDGLLKDLRSGSRETRLKAVGQLVALGGRGGQAAVAEAKSGLQDTDCMVREWAVKAVAVACTRGDSVAVEAFCVALRDSHWSVRRAAAERMPCVAEVGDARALEALHKALKDWSAAVRLGALQALLGLQDPDSLALLCIHVADEDLMVRLKALQSLGSTAPKGDSSVTTLLCERMLKEEDCCARLVIKKLLTEFAPEGEVCSAAVLGEAEREAAADAAEALGRLGTGGHEDLFVGLPGGDNTTT